MEIKGAIFDMDGTLVESLHFWDWFWEKCGLYYTKTPCFRPSKEDDTAVRTMTLYDSMEFIHKKYHFAESGEKLHIFAMDLLESFYGEAASLKPGAKEFLEYLKGKGVKMGLASANAMNLLNYALEHFGITKYFTEIVSCDDIGKGKSEPDVFLAALSALKTDIEETYVFEDSLLAIKTAKSAGFKTVGVYDRFNFGHKEMEQITDFYIAEGETLEKLIN